jgi:hypothetical protein
MNGESEMFRIPAYNEMELTFDEAVKIMKGRANGDLLEGLQSMDSLWADYIKSDDQNDEEFFDNWQYEVNAYNVVVENMRPLFEISSN